MNVHSTVNQLQSYLVDNSHIRVFFMDTQSDDESVRRPSLPPLTLSAAPQPLTARQPLLCSARDAGSIMSCAVACVLGWPPCEHIAWSAAADLKASMYSPSSAQHLLYLSLKCIFGQLVMHTEGLATSIRHVVPTAMAGAHICEASVNEDALANLWPLQQRA